MVISDSMHPTLAAGDVAITAPAGTSEAVVGRVALIGRSDGTTTTIHRIVAGTTTTGYTSRGDANAVPDSGTVQAGEIQGLLRVRIPWVGLPALWWDEGRYARLIAFGAFLAAGSELLIRREAGRARTLSATAVLVPAGVVSIAAVLGVGYASAAATTPSTVNAGNTFTTATVSLTGAPSTALWSSADTDPAQPGSRGEACVTVTYSGSVAADVRLMPVGATSTSDAYVRLSIERGTAPASASCDGFGGTVTPVYNPNNDDASTWAALKAGGAGGIDTWTSSVIGDFRVYRVRWTVLDDDAAAGQPFTLGLRWSAANT